MSKKLTFLIVALECVFAVFLISIFGPMIESLHTVIIVDDIHFINENGEYVYTVEGADDLTITVTFKADPNASTKEPSDKTGCGCGSNILNETMLITVLALVATVSCIRRKKDF